MRKAKIITHYGKAHRDEFLACCVILFHEYRNGCLGYIERRVVSSADLQNPSVWVVDAGNEYDPARKNFDHHHIQTDMCALDMVLMHVLGDQCYNNYKAASPWLKNTAIHDNNGAKVAADRLGMEIGAYMSTKSPIEKFILDRFSETMVIHCESHLALLMRDIGRTLVTNAEHLNEEFPEMIAAAPPPVDHLGARVWDIRSVTCDDSASLTMLNQAAYARGVDLMISSTTRAGGGVGVYRQSWARSRVDLGLIREHPKVRFAHKNGYYAVIDSDVDDSVLMSILAMAITASVPNNQNGE